jgi:thiol-disulfide isomerase/thioredoxin
MQRRRLTPLALMLALSLTAVACGADGEPTATGPAAEAPDTTVEVMEDAEAMEDGEAMKEDAEAMEDGEAMKEDAEAMKEDAEAMEDGEAMEEEAMVDLPAWQTMTITDVDGATFTLDDFHGTPVLVETFATWCPNCRAQLTATDQFASAAGDTVAVVALSVETDLPPEEVKAYAEENGFANVRFAVVSPELLAALVDGFGPTVANPPSTPKFVIDEMGLAGELTTGAESVEELSTKLGQGA